MQERNRLALKEWAVVIKALKEGKQIMLLRKGGIAEEAGEFQVEHDEFFLYPTFSHQEKQSIRQAFLKDFEEAREVPELWGRVRIESYAVVEEVVEAKALDRLQRLEDHHIWTPAYVDLRFRYRPENPFYVMLLRTYLLPEAFVLEETGAYRGCKSWVKLDEELSTAGCRPALSDAAFRAKAQAIGEVLQTPCGP